VGIPLALRGSAGIGTTSRNTADAAARWRAGESSWELEDWQELLAKALYGI